MDIQGQPEVDPSLLERAEREPQNFQAQLEAAYACDRAGQEERAIGYYEAAYRLGFPEGFERAGFLLGFGSTLKNVGRLAESEAVLRDAMAGEVESDALALFLALTLQAQGRHHEALAQALEVCLRHPSPAVARYSRALQEYVSELRQIDV